MSENAKLIIMVVALAGGLFAVARQFKVSRLSAYTIFYTGGISLLLGGYLASYFLAEKNYILKGDTTLLEPIYWDLMQFFAISTVMFFLQRKFKLTKEIQSGRILPISSRANRMCNIAAVFSAMFVLLIMISANMSEAPLLNIGRYSQLEMAEARDVFYRTGFLDLLKVPRYIVYYLIAPMFFFLRGIGVKITFVSLAVFFIASLLTLAKTMFVLLTLAYFAGRYFSDKKLRNVSYAMIINLLGFYFIVYATYLADASRGFFEVVEVYFLRIFSIPISLAALYAEYFPFEDGVRSSKYYTYFFGGHADAIAAMAFKIIFPFGAIDGNAPAGVIGSAYPNVPETLHWLFYLAVVLFVFVSSNLIAGIANRLVREMITALFGILSCFIFLTDPLTAINSYGLLYMVIFTCLIRYLKPHRLVKGYDNP